MTARTPLGRSQLTGGAGAWRGAFHGEDRDACKHKPEKTKRGYANIGLARCEKAQGGNAPATCALDVPVTARSAAHALPAAFQESANIKYVQVAMSAAGGLLGFRDAVERHKHTSAVPRVSRLRAHQDRVERVSPLYVPASKSPGCERQQSGPGRCGRARGRALNTRNACCIWGSAEFLLFN